MKRMLLLRILLLVSMPVCAVPGAVVLGGESDLPVEHRKTYRDRRDKDRDEGRDRDADRDRDPDRSPDRSLFSEDEDDDDDDSGERGRRGDGLLSTRSADGSEGPVLPGDPKGECWFEGRIGLGLEIYDDLEFGLGPLLEVELRRRVTGPLLLGVLLGLGISDNDQTGALARGTFETTNLLVTATLEIPLGRGWRDPVLSLGGGAGALFVNPDPDGDLDRDLDRLGLDLEEKNFCLFDARLRADLMLPLAKDRGSFLTLGIVRDHAAGEVETRLKDSATGEVLSTSRHDHTFSRLGIHVSVVLRF